jgi:hypothetical protein
MQPENEPPRSYNPDEIFDQFIVRIIMWLILAGIILLLIWVWKSDRDMVSAAKMIYATNYMEETICDIASSRMTSGEDSAPFNPVTDAPNKEIKKRWPNQMEVIASINEERKAMYERVHSKEETAQSWCRYFNSLTVEHDTESKESFEHNFEKEYKFLE